MISDCGFGISDSMLLSLGHGFGSAQPSVFIGRRLNDLC